MQRASDMERFRDRRDAGARLGHALRAYADREDVVVLGLPRGGVAVASEIAAVLDAPLDVLVVRKLGIPGYEDIAMGALASGGIQVIDRHITKQLGITAGEIRNAAEHEARELARREEALRGDRAPIDVAGKTVIVVDDGLATGSTMLAATTALRLRNPAEIVVAVPVGSPEVCGALRTHVDDLHCLHAPAELESIGAWYAEFAQLTDEDVRGLVCRAQPTLRGPHGIDPSSHHRHRDPAARRT